MTQPASTPKHLTLRQRVDRSPLLARTSARIIGAYLTLCNRTTKWESEGLEELKTALQDGPVLVLIWHQRTLMASYHWPIKEGPITTLHSTSPIARVAGALQQLHGMQSMEMSPDTSNLAASRKVLRKFREGISIGMTGDGPLGPDHVLKTAPLEWAQRGPMRVWGYGFGTEKHRKLDSWDKMVLPRPFTRGRYIFAPFDYPLTTKPTAEEAELALAAMTEFLNNIDARLERPYAD